MASAKGTITRITYCARVARAPSFTASVFLPTRASVSRSRKLFTTRMAVASAPTAVPACHAMGGT